MRLPLPRLMLKLKLPPKNPSKLIEPRLRLFKMNSTVRKLLMLPRLRPTMSPRKLTKLPTFPQPEMPDSPHLRPTPDIFPSITGLRTKELLDPPTGNLLKPAKVRKKPRRRRRRLMPPLRRRRPPLLRKPRKLPLKKLPPRRRPRRPKLPLRARRSRKPPRRKKPLEPVKRRDPKTLRKPRRKRPRLKPRKPLPPSRRRKKPRLLLHQRLKPLLLRRPPRLLPHSELIWVWISQIKNCDSALIFKSPLIININI